MGRATGDPLPAGPDDPAPELTDPYPVRPLEEPPDAAPRLPGSKSITNRALVCAALADGPSVLEGALVSDDTEAMLDCLGRLGVDLRVLGTASGLPRIEVRGSAGALDGDGSPLDARLSGTTARFVAPLLLLGGPGRVLDGGPPLRARPMADLLEALQALGASVESLGDPGHLPVRITPPVGGVETPEVSVRGDVSSQFLSGLLLAAPAMRHGLRIRLETALVSRPYVDMTVSVMRSFGARVSTGAEGAAPVIEVDPGGYVGTRYRVEPDASAASYFFALAAAGGGRVRVEGLGNGSMQGDLGFVRVLERMGARVEVGADSTEVRGTGALEGVQVDMVDISDTSPTLAAIAPLASSRVEVRGIGFVRGKETDRIAAVVAELTRLGVDARERTDGFVVEPGRIRPAVVSTYDDHRMAMSFAVLGLLSEGVSIADPGCVDKTFPGFWEEVESLRGAGAGRGAP